VIPAIEQRTAGALPPLRPSADLAELVLAWLPRGRANAVTIERLAHRVGAPHRDVEQTLQELADAGMAPICASSQRPMGVWLGTKGDVRDDLERHDARIRSMLRRRHGLRRWLTTPEPRPVQEQLWEVAR
jgi:hypothetical protein